MNKIKITFVVCFILLISCIVFYLNLFKTTNSATLEIQTIDFIPDVEGQVIELSVDNGSKVQKGEILARINPDKYNKILSDAQEKLKKAQDDFKISSSDLEKIKIISSQNKENIESAKLKLENANSDYIRYKMAFQDGSVTKKDLENAIKNLNVATNLYKEIQQEHELIKEKYNSSLLKKSSKDVEIKKLLAQIEKAKLDLSYTTIISPMNGTISENKIKIGQYVNNKKPIFKIISKDCYVVADFKTIDVNNIKLNQKATVRIENNNFKGRIKSIEENDLKTTIKILLKDDISNLDISNKNDILVRIKTK